MSTADNDIDDNMNENANDDDAPTINNIPLPVLLSTCIDACRRGCEVIRSVHCRSLKAGATGIAREGREMGVVAVRETSDGSMVIMGSLSQSSSSSSPRSPPTAPNLLSSPTRTIAHTFKSTSHNTYDPLTDTTEIDPRSALTEADEASQAVVMECLCYCWEKEMKAGKGGIKPRLWVVGEEDDNGEQSFNITASSSGEDGDCYEIFDRYNVPRPDVAPILRNAVQEMAEGQHRELGLKLQMLSPRQHEQHDNQDELIVFIDPLDGTREYIENRIHNVQCLIGITWNGIPIAGAVGLPFGSGNKNDDDNVIEVAYGWIMPVNDDAMPNSNSTDSSWNVLSSGVKHFDATNIMPSHDPTPEDNAGLLSFLDAGDDDVDTLVVLSGDSKKPALQMTMDCLENQVLVDASSSVEQDKNVQEIRDKHVPSYRKIISGGCGNKILYLGRRFQILTAKKQRLRDTEDASLVLPPIVGTMAISPPGSSSWDTAAPTAVLLSIDPNALVTDLVGRPLVYDGKQLTNVFGVVVSCGDGAVKVHKELCRRLAENEEFCQVIGINT